MLFTVHKLYQFKIQYKLGNVKQQNDLTALKCTLSTTIERSATNFQKQTGVFVL